MEKYFKLKFWFNLMPGPLNLGILKALIILFAVFLFLSFVFVYLSSRTKKKDKLLSRLYEKLYVFFSVCSATGFLFLFFFYERAYFLSARFWFLLWLLMFVIWLFFIIKFAVKDIPYYRKQAQERKNFEKYLPK